MDEKIIKHIEDICEKYELLYHDNKIVIAPDIEIRIRTNKNQKSIYFHEFVFNTGFNHYSINYTINRMYRCYFYLDRYKDFDEIEEAIEYCIKTILENYKKAFES